jgi:hypothetical protein
MFINRDDTLEQLRTYIKNDKNEIIKGINNRSGL